MVVPISIKHYPAICFVVLLVCIGCRPKADRSGAADYMRAPGPDTTFYQEASWSPDGSRLFLSRLDIHLSYRSSVSVVNADGSDYVPLTSGPRDRWTTSSPGGSRIAFASTRDDNQDIYLMDLDGGTTQRLTVDAASDTHPDWSPDGTRIAFVSDRDGTADIFVMNADGSRQRRISTGPEEKGNPRWSPDGSKIAYYGSTDGTRDSIYVMNADGSDKQTLSAGFWPTWSPDGSKILISHADTLYSLRLDTGERSLVVANAFFGRWSPDGSRIAFVRGTWEAPEGWPSTSDVFVMDVDGSNEIRVTGRAHTRTLE